MLSVIKLLQKLTTNMIDYFCKTGENSAYEIFRETVYNTPVFHFPWKKNSEP